MTLLILNDFIFKFDIFLHELNFIKRYTETYNSFQTK